MASGNEQNKDPPDPSESVLDRSSSPIVMTDFVHQSRSGEAPYSSASSSELQQPQPSLGSPQPLPLPPSLPQPLPPPPPPLLPPRLQNLKMPPPSPPPDDRGNLHLDVCALGFALGRSHVGSVIETEYADSDDDFPSDDDLPWGDDDDAYLKMSTVTSYSSQSKMAPSSDSAHLPRHQATSTHSPRSKIPPRSYLASPPPPPNTHPHSIHPLPKRRPPPPNTHSHSIQPPLLPAALPKQRPSPPEIHSFSMYLPSPPPPLPQKGIPLSPERTASHVPLRRHKRPTPYYVEASWTAQVPFLHHKLLECDHHGLEYIIEDHDITLRIPPEAIPVGKKVHFEIAVAMYGPFSFPDNTQPISPILWCCFEDSSTLSKPFQLILPHFLKGLTKEKASLHSVAFAKAHHDDYSTESGPIKYNFQCCDDEARFASSAGRSFGVLTTDHCCFYCLQANQTHELAVDAGYCLARIESFISQQRSEVHFAAVYCLPTCLRALEEQYQVEGAHKITNYNEFVFKDGKTDPHLKIIPSQQSQFVIAMEPSSAKIRAADINFWRKGFDAMQLRHERKMYPPRVKMTVTMEKTDKFVKLPVKIEGSEGDDQLDTELTFPLGLSFLLSSQCSSLSGSEHHSHEITCKPPELRDAFKKTLPLAAKWKTIGTLLGVQNNTLDKIQMDENGADDQLRKMLSEWLKQVDPPPSWAALADAVEAVDELKAKEIRDSCLDISDNP